MAMDASEIENFIKEAMPDAEIKIEDLRGDGNHYSCQVISKEFTFSGDNSGLPETIKPYVVVCWR